MKGVFGRTASGAFSGGYYDIFEETYISPRSVFDIPECHFRQTDGIRASVTIEQRREEKRLKRRAMDVWTR